VGENELSPIGGPLAPAEVVRRGMAGDQSMLPAVRELLRQMPDLIEQVGNLAAVARGELLRHSSRGNLVLREAEETFMAKLGDEIGGEAPSPLERLLVERILMCWLHVQIAERRYAQAKDKPLMKVAFYEKLLDKAQRRYLAAIKSLAQVRRLELLPM